MGSIERRNSRRVACQACARRSSWGRRIGRPRSRLDFHPRLGFAWIETDYRRFSLPIFHDRVCSLSLLVVEKGLRSWMDRVLLYFSSLFFFWINIVAIYIYFFALCFLIDWKWFFRTFWEESGFRLWGNVIRSPWVWMKWDFEFNFNIDAGRRIYIHNGYYYILLQINYTIYYYPRYTRLEWI